MADKVFTAAARMYWEDTDAGGIVYHANYLRYMERARTEMLRELGYEQERLRAEGLPLIVVAGIDISFKRPARLDDLLAIETRLVQLRRASMTFEQRILRGQTLICQARVRCAALDPGRGCATAVPPAFYEAILPYLCSQESA
ncbi:MAG: tol-pal system-associated acyl-CoA thioesterase [Duodenibacillus sp.]|nr:tol-pal system-associated acyl-CoA thioesterase [Duodenibacillus sp.]